MSLLLTFRWDRPIMIYQILKYIFSYAVRKYFVTIRIENENRIPLDRPVLLLPNHRSAFMDPIIVATQIKRTTYFLTRGESFNNKWAVKVFKRLKMVPIFRKEHDPDKTHQNKDIFKYCHSLMAEGGCMMIFPEGVCQTKYTLAPVKTGAARIALEAEKENEFALDVHLIPVGINYSNPHRFRGSVTLNIGEPIRALDYKEDFLKDEWKTIKQVTQEVDQRLRSLIIVLEDQDQMEYVKKLEHLLQGHPDIVSLRKSGWFAQRRELLEVLKRMQSEDPQKYEGFIDQLEEHFKALKRLGVNARFDPDRSIGLRLGRNKWVRALLLIGGFPLALIGFILHYLPFIITRRLSLAVVKRVDFMGSVALVLGVLFFTVFCCFETWLVHHYIGKWWLTATFFLVWPTIGLFTYGYLAELVAWIDGRNWKVLGKRKRNLQNRLSKERLDLITQFMSYHTKGVDTPERVVSP